MSTARPRDGFDVKIGLVITQVNYDKTRKTRFCDNKDPIHKLTCDRDCRPCLGCQSCIDLRSCDSDREKGKELAKLFGCTEIRELRDSSAKEFHKMIEDLKVDFYTLV